MASILVMSLDEVGPSVDTEKNIHCTSDETMEDMGVLQKRLNKL